MNGNRPVLPSFLSFEVDEPIRVTGIRFNYLSDPDGGDDTESLNLRIEQGGNVLASATTNLDLGAVDQSETITFDTPFNASPDINHQLIAENSGTGVIKADTSRFVNEHWDDLIPVRLPDKDGYAFYYSEVDGGQRPVTHPDNPEKLQEIYQWLDQADYIFLTSQRAVWSLPRIPFKYPVMIEYYDALFSGELGFELVAEFHATQQIGPLYISDTAGAIGWGEPPTIGWPPPGDLAAEEAFSVYDHPPVWIFQKTDDYNFRTVQEVLGSVDLTQVLDMNPGQATQAPNGLLLTEQEFATQQANGTFSEIFNPVWPIVAKPDPRRCCLVAGGDFAGLVGLPADLPPFARPDQ